MSDKVRNILRCITMLLCIALAVIYIIDKSYIIAAVWGAAGILHIIAFILDLKKSE